jgi:putative FmdB family regulatory protein
MSPTYTYRCIQCDWEIDINKPIDSRDSEQKCGSCNELMQRVISKNISAVFMGNGWGSKP